MSFFTFCIGLGHHVAIIRVDGVAPWSFIVGGRDIKGAKRSGARKGIACCLVVQKTTVFILSSISLS